MKLRDDDPAPEGYDTWQPRMGRGGKLVAWTVLVMIGLGTALMIWQGVGQWLR